MTAIASRRMRPRSMAVRRRRELTRWPQVCLLALVLVTTFQLRVRAADASLAGTVDLQVLLEVVVYGVVGAFAVTRIRMVRSGPPPMLAVITGLYFATIVLSLLSSPVLLFSAVRLCQTLCLLALVYALAQAASRSMIHEAMHGIVLIALAAIAGGVLTGYREERHPDRFTFWNVHPNNAAFLLAIAALVTACYLWHRRVHDQLRWRRGTYWAVLMTLGAALVATGSRTIMLAALAGLLVIGWHAAPRRVDVAIIGLLCLGLIGVLGSSTVESLVSRGQTAEEVSSLSSRSGLWERSTELIAQRPLLGHGYGGSRQVFSGEEFHGVGGAHNALLEVVLDAGLVSGALLVILVGACLRQAWIAARNSHPDGALLLGLLTLLAVRGVTEQGLGQLATTSTLWLLVCVGWLLVISGQSSRSKETHGVQRLD